MLFSNIIITDPVEKFELVFVVICLLSDAPIARTLLLLALPILELVSSMAVLSPNISIWFLKQRNGTQEATERNKKSRSSEDSRRAFDLFDPSRELGSLKPSVLNFI